MQARNESGHKEAVPHLHRLVETHQQIPHTRLYPSKPQPVVRRVPSGDVHLIKKRPKTNKQKQKQKETGRGKGLGVGGAATGGEEAASRKRER